MRDADVAHTRSNFTPTGKMCVIRNNNQHKPFSFEMKFRSESWIAEVIQLSKLFYWIFHINSDFIMIQEKNVWPSVQEGAGLEDWWIFISLLIWIPEHSRERSVRMYIKQQLDKLHQHQSAASEL